MGVEADRHVAVEYLERWWWRVHYGMTLTQADLLRRIRLRNETYAFFFSLSPLYSRSQACNEILTRPVWQPFKLHALFTQRA